MAGVAQLWLTEKEAAALLMAATSIRHKVSDKLLDAGLRDKLVAASAGTACPIAARPTPTLEESQRLWHDAVKKLTPRENPDDIPEIG